MIATVTNHVSHGLKSPDNSVSFTFFNTTFGLPVGNIWSGASDLTPDPQFLTETTSYDLSSIQNGGLEVCIGAANFSFINDSGTTYNLNTNVYCYWKNTGGTVYASNNKNITASIAPGYGVVIWLLVNTGCDPWEISTAGTYYFGGSATGTPNISASETAVTMSNVPINTQSGGATQYLLATDGGYIWVEGNNLAFKNAWGWKHYIVGIDNDFVTGDVGYLWCSDIDGLLHWIGANGHDYNLPWMIKQFASTFSPGYSGSVYAGTGSGGYLWMEASSSATTMAFINPADGYKYLAGAGAYPY